MLQLTPGNLITHLRKLEDAGYLNTETTDNGRGSRTAIELTRHGRAAGAVVRKSLQRFRTYKVDADIAPSAKQ